MAEFFIKFARNGHLFLVGLGSITDISGKTLMSITEQEQTISALGRDFQAVGNDIRFAMSQYKAMAAVKDQEQLELALR